MICMREDFSPPKFPGALVGCISPRANRLHPVDRKNKTNKHRVPPGSRPFEKQVNNRFETTVWFWAVRNNNLVQRAVRTNLFRAGRSSHTVVSNSSLETNSLKQFGVWFLFVVVCLLFCFVFLLRLCSQVRRPSPSSIVVAHRKMAPRQKVG